MSRPRRLGLLAGVASLGAIAALIGASAPSGPILAGARAFADDFDEGLCVGACPGAIWAIRQQVRGDVATMPAPGRAGLALRASAGSKIGDEVAKAGLVARTRPITDGMTVAVGFDLFVPPATPLNSIQLVDLECAGCGEGGNPGIRLYLRHGRLRIDRSKIGIADAWTRDDAPSLGHDRWHHIELTVRIGDEHSGTARVMLDGQEVLAATGATAFAGRRRQIDRIQIGVTANSNPVPVTLYLDDVRLRRL